MATYSSISAWRIPWTVEPGSLQSMGSQRLGYDWETNTLGWLWTDKSKVKVINLMFVNILVCAQSCPTLWNPMDCSPPGSSVHEISQAGILEVGCHFLLKGIFPTQGPNPHFLHCRWILYLWATREALLLGIYPDGVENWSPHRNLHMGVYSSFVHHCKNLEATKIFFNRRMDKLWYIQTMEYYSALKTNELSIIKRYAAAAAGTLNI